ncbi:MAG: BrnT family toxin [Acidobacteriota bacterium]
MGSCKGEAQSSETWGRFRGCGGVFEDNRALTIEDPSSEDEQRWVSIGMDCLGRVLVVVHTWRGG